MPHPHRSEEGFEGSTAQQHCSATTKDSWRSAAARGESRLLLLQKNEVLPLKLPLSSDSRYNEGWWMKPYGYLKKLSGAFNGASWQLAEKMSHAVVLPKVTKCGSKTTLN